MISRDSAPSNKADKILLETLSCSENLVVIGSMGIVGIAGYGYQIFTRVREVIKRFNPFVMILGLSYLGVFLMTQVNPGEFCPLPYEMMVVMLFAIIEKEPERVKIKN